MEASLVGELVGVKSELRDACTELVQRSAELQQLRQVVCVMYDVIGSRLL